MNVLSCILSTVSFFSATVDPVDIALIIFDTITTIVAFSILCARCKRLTQQNQVLQQQITALEQQLFDTMESKASADNRGDSNPYNV